MFKETIPKAWLEKRLLKIPFRIRSLQLKLTSPKDEPCLTESELCQLIESLLRLKERKQTFTEAQKPIHACLPLVARTGHASKFVIPGSRTKTNEKEMNEGILFRYPLTSLEIGGDGMTMTVLKELIFWCMHWSNGCLLKDLVLLDGPLETPPEGNLLGRLNFERCRFRDVFVSVWSVKTIFASFGCEELSCFRNSM